MSDATDYEGSSYEELVSLLESLPLLVREARRRRRMSIRAAAASAGIDPTTFNRCEQSAVNMQLSTALPLLRWIGVNDVGEDPNVACPGCGETRDALTGRVIHAGGAS